jgi:hypothetical protein
MGTRRKAVAKITAKAQLIIVLNNLGKWHDAAVTMSHLTELQDDGRAVFPKINKKLKDEARKKYRKYYKKSKEAASGLLLQDLILT